MKSGSKTPCLVAAAPQRMAVTRYTIVVVRLAAIVPFGILPCASFRSPDRLLPAIIPAKVCRLIRYD